MRTVVVCNIVSLDGFYAVEGIPAIDVSVALYLVESRPFRSSSNVLLRYATKKH